MSTLNLVTGTQCGFNHPISHTTHVNMECELLYLVLQATSLLKMRETKKFEMTDILGDGPH